MTKYYAQVNSKGILQEIDLGFITDDEYGSTDVKNIEVSEEYYNNAKQYGTNYYMYSNGEIVLNPNYEAEQAQKEKERINQLSLTKREVFLALYNDKGITPEQIKAQITNPAVLIEFEYANDYFRGNPLIDTLGLALGYTKEQLDYLFEHKEFPKEEE